MENQKQILEYAQVELPETETRISEPMRPECKVAVCIPAFKEKDSLMTTLEFLSQQNGVAMDEFETVINVNNREDANQNDRKQNEQLLNLLKHLEGEDAPVDFLSDEEKKIIEKIKESGLVVRCIDKSTKGNEVKSSEDERWKNKPDDNPAKCMQPRKRAMDEICERFVLAGRTDGIIASLDADTKVGKNWVKQIIENFKNKDVQLLAGERRDGLDMTEDGNLIGRNEVMERLLDNWNSEERRTDEAFGDLPNIENGLQRANILLMNNLTGVYNTAMGHFRREIEGRTGVIENFKGGTGKMFRVGTYIKHPLEIIKIMDAGGAKMDDIGESSFKYVGRDKSEKTAPTTSDAEIEALAVYPETRVRGWDVKSKDKQNPYRDFNALYGPFGSSGKEYAYAIAAGLKEQIPTTFNEEAAEAKRAVEDFIRNGQTEESRQVLEGFFDKKTIKQIESITPEEMEKLSQSDTGTLKKYKPLVEKMKGMSKPVSITDAIRFYGRKNPEEQTYNPERYFFGNLARELVRSKGEDKSAIRDKIKDTYNLDDGLIEQMLNLQSESELLDFAKNNPEIQRVSANLPENISYSDAADKYEKLLNFK